METNLDRFCCKIGLSTNGLISFPDYPIKFWYFAFRKTGLFLLTVLLEFFLFMRPSYTCVFPWLNGVQRTIKWHLKPHVIEFDFHYNLKRFYNLLTPILKATFVTSVFQGTLTQDWKFFDLWFSTALNSKFKKRFVRNSTHLTSIKFRDYIVGLVFVVYTHAY
jgi:hypothetical protein